jgi:lysophospholipase L1-like esterase
MKTLRILCLVFSSAYLSAQVPVSASHIQDSFGQPIALARLCFAPVDATRTLTGFRAGSVQVVPNEVCAQVTNGVMAGHSVVPSPSGVYYHIYLKKPNSNDVLRDYGMTPITASWTLDTYDPNLVTLPVTALSAGSTTTVAPGVGASCNLSGSNPALLNCNIPQGASGAKGDPGTVNCVAPNCGTNGDYTVGGKLNLTNNLISTNPGTVVRAWGNSITQGFGLSGCGSLTCHPSQAWPQVFANTMGWTLDNQAYGSSQCSDLTYSGTSESMWDTGAMAITTSSRSIYGHIHNDHNLGIAPLGLDYARGCIEAEMAWLAIPEQTVLPGGGKIRAAGTGCSKTGTWTDGSPNAAASFGTTAGATITCNVIGKTVYVAATKIFGSSATFTVTVDGNLVSDQISQTNTFSQNLASSTGPAFPVNTNVLPYLIRVPGLTNTPHTVVYTCVTTAPIGCGVLYMAGVGQDNGTANGPFVYSFGDSYNAPSQQTGVLTPQFTTLFYDTWRRVVGELAQDGLQVVPIDATNPNVYNPWDPTMVQSDGIHPSVLGHAAIAAAAVAKATSAATPLDRTESKIPNAGYCYGGFGSGTCPSPAAAGTMNIGYILPPGFLFTSTGGDSGRVYFGSKGGAFLERLADDHVNALGYGTGHIFVFNQVDGIAANLAVTGQLTSDQSGPDTGGLLVARNGAGFVDCGVQGSNGSGVSNWANNGLCSTNRNLVFNADLGKIFFQSAHIDVGFMDNVGWHVNAIVPTASSVLTGSCSAFPLGTIVPSLDGHAASCTAAGWSTRW